jgi:hypothetical protein
MKGWVHIGAQASRRPPAIIKIQKNLSVVSVVSVAKNFGGF